MALRVQWTRAADKQFSKLELRVQKAVAKKVAGLTHGVFQNCEKITDTEDLYRMRVGEFRVRYRRRNADITILTVKDRKEAYD